MAEIDISIIRYVVPLDPPIDIFSLVVKRSDGSSWASTIATEEGVKLFCEGVAASNGANVNVQPIPREAQPLPDMTGAGIPGDADDSDGRPEDEADDLPF